MQQRNTITHSREYQISGYGYEYLDTQIFASIKPKRQIAGRGLQQYDNDKTYHSDYQYRRHSNNCVPSRKFI